jgi:hypothetical protein
MTFQSTFDSWLDRSLSETIPDDVVAYTFNLAEPWSIEVVGCGSFDADDPDWACDEAFRPVEPLLLLPSEHFGADWATVQGRCAELLRSILASDSLASQRLKASQAVGLGFVDGDLELLWSQPI